MARRRRKTNLGAPFRWHAKEARTNLRYTQDDIKHTLEAVKRGDCAKAIDYLEVSDMNYGAFLTNVRAGGFAHRIQPTSDRLRSAIGEVRQLFRKRCLR